jgi:2-oxoglutarate ferredoxin oxidoreductase subunit beta
LLKLKTYFYLLILFIFTNSSTKILVFGKDQNKGIRLRVLKPVIVNLDEGVSEKELLTNDQFCEDSTPANLLSGFDYPDLPMPMGILRQVEYTHYEEKIEQQIKT